MHEPTVFEVHVHKHKPKTYAMPVLSIYKRLEYIMASEDNGVSSAICSWNDFNREFNPSFADFTEDFLNIFDEQDSTSRARELLKIYFEREERQNAPTLYPHAR